MKISDLDREEYAGIPIYSMGYQNDCELPVFICKYSDKDFTLSPLHRHNVIQINYISRGRLMHQVNNARYELVRGDIFIIPPYIPHQLVNIGKNDFEVIELEFSPEFIFGKELNSYHTIDDSPSVFDFSYIEPFLVSECNVRPRLNLTGKNQLKVEELLDEIREEFNNRSDSYLMALKADLLKLLVILGRTFHEGMKNSPEMQLFNHHRDAMIQAVHFIDEHYEEPITIEEVARLALLSQSYFSYLFKTLTDKTFVEYLHMMRIKKAMEMLKTTELRVVDICYDSGFNNINHFNRTFKTIVGASPTQYRASNRKKKNGKPHGDTQHNT